MSVMTCRLLGRCSRHSRASLAAVPKFMTPRRSFSSYDEQKPPGQTVVIQVILQNSSFSWPDTRLGPLEPSDSRLPLPGMVGGLSKPEKTASTQKKPPSESELLTEELPYERHSTIYEQFVTVSKELAKKSNSREAKSSPFDVLECSAHECPYVLLNDFRDIFPTFNFSGPGGLTIITMHEKCNGGGRAKESSVDENVRRIDLVEQFISAATDLCDSMHLAGYWADFIDPTSGRPYLADNTDALLYEKDSRYRQSGFEIDSVSGCRVVMHHQLGTRSYVGCIFTKAPLDHPLIASLVQNFSDLDD